MVARENRVLVVSTTVAMLLLVAGAVTGVGENDVVLGLVLVVGVGLIGPQLYLAATTDAVDPRRRVRLAALTALVHVGGFYAVAEPAQRPVAAGAGLVVLAVFAGYEVVERGAVAE